MLFIIHALVSGVEYRSDNVYFVFWNCILQMELVYERIHLHSIEITQWKEEPYRIHTHNVEFK